MIQNKLLILGYKRSGKDTAAEYWKKTFGMDYKSSSLAASELFIFDALKDKYNYSTPEECFEDRVNHRSEWYDMICEYNKDSSTRLARDITSKHGTYVGMRDTKEVNACKDEKLFDLIIWVDAEERVGKEDLDSCNVTKECADIIIENNNSEEEFYTKLHKLGSIIFKK